MAHHCKGFKIALLVFFALVAASHSFFVTSKDIKKLLDIFPKAFEVDNHHKARPLPYRRRENDYRYRDEYTYDNYDRNDNVKNFKGKIDHRRITNDRLHHHSHENCDHHDHLHHHQQHHVKYPEDRVEKHHSKHSEEMKDYYSQNERKRHEEEKKKVMIILNENDDKNYEKNSKKDYVTGILVSIPKIKSDEDLENYYKDKQNLFLQHLLKTDEEERHNHRTEDDVKSYLY